MASKDKRTRIEEYLREAAAGISGSRVRVIINADGSIDGELFAPIGASDTVEEKFESIQDVLRDERVPGTFVSAGFRFEPSSRIPTKNDYNRHRGLYQVFSNYYKSPPLAIDTVRDIITGESNKGRGMRRKGYKKPIQMIYRVHWNKYGMKPPREGGK